MAFIYRHNVIFLRWKFSFFNCFFTLLNPELKIHEMNCKHNQILTYLCTETLMSGGRSVKINDDFPHTELPFHCWSQIQFQPLQTLQFFSWLQELPHLRSSFVADPGSGCVLKNLSKADKNKASAATYFSSKPNCMRCCFEWNTVLTLHLYPLQQKTKKIHIFQNSISC